MRVLVCGSRSWTDKTPIKRRLCLLPGSVTVVHGAARGADALAGQVAAELNFAVEEYPADWNRHGRAAGPMRNIEMLDSGVDLVLAFRVGDSPGTKHCLSAAKSRGLPIEIFDQWGQTA